MNDSAEMNGETGLMAPSLFLRNSKIFYCKTFLDNKLSLEMVLFISSSENDLQEIHLETSREDDETASGDEVIEGQDQQ